MIQYFILVAVSENYRFNFFKDMCPLDMPTIRETARYVGF